MVSFGFKLITAAKKIECRTVHQHSVSDQGCAADKQAGSWDGDEDDEDDEDAGDVDDDDDFVHFDMYENDDGDDHGLHGNHDDKSGGTGFDWDEDALTIKDKCLPLVFNDYDYNDVDEYVVLMMMVMMMMMMSIWWA